MKLCEVDMCTGCMACVNICSKKAISATSDAEGFLRPEIDLLRCINCGLCTSVCPQIVREEPKTYLNNSSFNKIVFACWLKSKDILKQSSSGGAFTALAEPILLNNGVVYGAGFDEAQKVVHKRVTTKDQLAELRGSKYVQSEIGNSYLKVLADLTQGRQVLFTGTPCQIDGLYSFLGKRYSGQLYTADIVCHGVPSPLVFSDYLHFMEERYRSKVSSIAFRNKKPGWYVYGMRIVFENGQLYERDNWHDPFHRGFLRNFFLRPSCYQCRYANVNRIADITLADDWGYRETNLRDRDNDQGISMVMINNQNGIDLFEKAQKKLNVFSRSVEGAIRGNPALNKPFEQPKNREQFWEDYLRLPFETIVEKYLYEEDIPQWLSERKKRIEKARKERLISIPKRIAKAVVGKKRYEAIKRALKR